MWMWCLKKNHSTTPPRYPEQGGGHRVQSDDRPVRLETEPGNLQEDQSGHGSGADRPVCIQADYSVPTLFQLAARSLCRGHRCIPAGLVSRERLCQPAIWNLVGKVLAHVQSQQAQVVLVAPVWKTQPWYPLLLSMIVQCPYLINQGPEVIVHQPQPVLDTQLAVWNISDRDTESRSFWRMLPHSCSSLGEPRLTGLTTHCSQGGIAGVVNGTQIPFLAL